LVPAARAAAAAVRKPILTAHQPAKSMLSARQDTSWANTKLAQPSAGINHLPYIASFVTRAPNGEYDGLIQHHQATHDAHAERQRERLQPVAEQVEVNASRGAEP
jgi:hypothetical protein